MNLDSLRRKRVKRKGVKTTAHTGQKHIFFILDRATRKFHGDMGLWMQYIEFARKQRANKKLSRILTDALRMHPTRPGLWIYAARYAIDVQADIGNARSYMQRGLRFCKHSRSMYLEYAHLEMGYIAKIAARRKILGLGTKKQEVQTKDIQDDQAETSLDADVIALPAEDLPEPTTGPILDQATIEDLSSTPAMNGAIPKAIFGAAMNEFDDDPEVGHSFFEMFADFVDVPCTCSLLQHVLDRLSSLDLSSAAAISCRCRMYILGIPHDSLDFPRAVGTLLKELRFVLSRIPNAQKPALSEKVLSWLSSLASNEALGPEIQQVLAATERQFLRDLPKDKTI